MADAGAPPGREPRAVSLPGYAVFAAMLSAAGLPIYIHAPAHYAANYGVGLTALAGILFVLRLLDVVQDPALGWLAARLRARRGTAVTAGVVLLAASMLGLFAVTPPVAPGLWFALTMTGLFSAFSFLTIAMYAEGVTSAGRLGRGSHLRLAGWRETGALLGVCAAAVAPTLLGDSGAPYAWFALGFAALCLVALILMRGQWGHAGGLAPSGFGAVLSDPVSRRLLLIALMNAAPVAVSSTLFLFYVESVLAARGWEGPLLVLFFLAAAASAPAWSRLAARFGERQMLLAAMALAVASFSVVLALEAGQVAAFAAVCLVSGAALGADFAILPALFARRMERVAPEAAAGFGLWAFVQKAALAFAAVVLLPALDAAGFSAAAGPANPSGALDMLTYLYALVPCVLKLGAMALLAATPLPATATATA
ncbi:MFS transporter [Roseibacterium sp. SDUM158017]|uniref:MFS transporter n=1 Tax=Roseicyclus salinarum TaxID=3036773 RepID=UPI0024157A94|nr:MFS transporter [Roseibacterium sp. SDUM158017]MDG4650475.1 MFS transporter [Roseibacterium sp. SDUM158017]